MQSKRQRTFSCLITIVMKIFCMSSLSVISASQSQLLDLDFQVSTVLISIYVSHALTRCLLIKNKSVVQNNIIKQKKTTIFSSMIMNLSVMRSLNWVMVWQRIRKKSALYATWVQSLALYLFVVIANILACAKIAISPVILSGSKSEVIIQLPIKLKWSLSPGKAFANS